MGSPEESECLHRRCLLRKGCHSNKIWLTIFFFQEVLTGPKIFPFQCLISSPKTLASTTFCSLAYRDMSKNLHLRGELVFILATY